jgi:hypothetical protein
MLPTPSVKSAAIRLFPHTNNIQKMEFMWVFYSFWNNWCKGIGTWIGATQWKPVTCKHSPITALEWSTRVGMEHTMNDEGRMLYDRKSAAVQLSISVRSLDYLIAAKRLATRRIGKKVLIPRGELLRFARGDHPEAVS